MEDVIFPIRPFTRAELLLIIMFIVLVCGELPGDWLIYKTVKEPWRYLLEKKTSH